MDDETVPTIPELTVAEVAARLGTQDFFIFDNNGPGRWKRSHVPGATNLNAYSFDRHDLPENTSATLVFYCSGPG
jgi:rhodanese-related sulfurtransferase